MDMQQAIEVLIKDSPDIIQYLKNEQKTLSVCKEAVDKDIKNFKYVPTIHYQEVFKHITAKKQDVDLLNMCHVDLVTEEMFKSAIRANPQILSSHNNNHWALIRKFMTETFCINLIKETPEMFQHLDAYRKNRLPIEIKLDLIRQNPNNLRHFNESMRWLELCELAAKLDPKAIIYIPEHFRTQNMCDAAFSINPELGKYIPKKFTTKEQLDVLLNKGIEITDNYLPLFRKHYFMRFYAMYPQKLKDLSREELTFEIISKAVEQNGSHILKDLNLDHITFIEWCKLIQINMQVFGKIPGHIKKQIILKGSATVLHEYATILKGSATILKG